MSGKQLTAVAVGSTIIALALLYGAISFSCDTNIGVLR